MSGLIVGPDDDVAHRLATIGIHPEQVAHRQLGGTRAPPGRPGRSPTLLPLSAPRRGGTLTPAMAPLNGRVHGQQGPPVPASRRHPGAPPRHRRFLLSRTPRCVCFP
jgi:hypothetical protein